MPYHRNYFKVSGATLIRRVQKDFKKVEVDGRDTGKVGRWPIRKRKYERKRYFPAG